MATATTEGRSTSSQARANGWHDLVELFDCLNARSTGLVSPQAGRLSVSAARATILHMHIYDVFAARTPIGPF